MDWNRCALYLAQVAVLGVLGALVATGHDSLITDGLMVIAGSIVGQGVALAVAKKKAVKPPE